MMKRSEDYNIVFTQEGFERLDIIVEKMKKEYHQKNHEYSEETLNGRVLTGLKDYDNRLGGFAPGTLNFIAGRPAAGKTTLMLDIAKNVVLYQKKPVYYFSLEMSSDQITRLFCSKLFAAPTLTDRNIRTHSFLNDMGIRKKIDNLPVYICDVTTISVTQIAKIISEYVKEGIVFIDYLELIDFKEEDLDNEKRKVMRDPMKYFDKQTIRGMIIKKLKDIAVMNGIPIVVKSHLSRNVEIRMEKRPICDDLNINEDTLDYLDTVTFLYRDSCYVKEKSSDKAELIIWKDKEKTDVVNLRLNKISRSFQNYR